MKKNIYISVLLIFLAAGAYTSFGQSLRLVRTDVDSSRAGFITAKYLFGIDIVAKDLFRCSAVSFSLKWTRNSYVKFSEWKIGYLGDSSTAFVYPHADIYSDEGILSVGVTASEPEVSKGYDNPLVIHLEFAVSQAAINSEDVVFAFTSARANINTDTGRYDIGLYTQPVYYKVHGYMDVWPGDADFNGTVDELDVLPIDEYFDYGSNVKKMRTFKRVNPSTLWVAQRVLAWDDEYAAHADCDGNGVVNETDVLVIYANVNKNHSSAKKEGQKPLGVKKLYKPCSTATSVSIPVRAGYSLPISGASAIVSWEGLPAGAEVLGFDKGDIFPGEKSGLFSHIDIEAKSAALAFGTFDNEFIADAGEGVLAYLVVEANGADLSGFRPLVGSLTGVTNYGYIFSLTEPNGIREELENGMAEFFYSNEILHINFSERDGRSSALKIYDLLGAVVYEKNILSGANENISLSGLMPGLYLAAINNSGKTYVYKFTVGR